MALLFGAWCGSLWGAGNLWCLAQTLRVWLNGRLPADSRERRVHRRRAIGWFVVKFPLLYTVAVGLLQLPGVSILGFGLGFLAVLAASMTVMIIRLQRQLQYASSHGR